MTIEKVISEKFADIVFDWNYETYLMVGGYGSGKSYNAAFKLILRCLTEKTKVLVVREVYATIPESCFDLMKDILNDMDLLSDNWRLQKHDSRVLYKKSPLEFIFPNGSRIIFKGMDKPMKIKSIHGVNIIWLEEASEIKYDAYKELLGRVRTENAKYILTLNPVSKDNWVYRHFICRLDDDGKETYLIDEKELYKNSSLIDYKRNIYFHHSVVIDNPFVPKEYIKRLDDMKTYDRTLWRIARHGMFGNTGILVLPQFEIAKDAKQFSESIKALGHNNRRIGFDFGFETSYNAIISMAVDTKNSILYIYDEVYKNKITDDKFIELPEVQKVKAQNILIKADNAEPKTIQYYKQMGFKIRPCRNKFAGSRLSNTKKVKRFKKIICSPKCVNTIRELRELTYDKDAKGNLIYDEFNIDPHTFSAIWYALDDITVADVKEEIRNSMKGAIR